MTTTYRGEDDKSLAFYLAARYSRREELCGYKEQLEARGHRVPARWLLGEHQVHGVEAARAVEAGGPMPLAEARLFAEDDIEDVLAADVLISFTEQPRRPSSSRGGRHVEFGIGLGMRRAGGLGHAPSLIIVGPLENVFHAAPEVDAAFDTWGDFLAYFDALPRVHGWDTTGNERCDAHPWHRWTNWHRAVYPRHFPTVQPA